MHQEKQPCDLADKCVVSERCPNYLNCIEGGFEPPSIDGLPFRDAIKVIIRELYREWRVHNDPTDASNISVVHVTCGDTIAVFKTGVELGEMVAKVADHECGNV